MSKLIGEVQRAIQARVGLIVLETPDLQGATEKVVKNLQENYHCTTLWDLVKGSQTATVGDGTLNYLTDWEEGDAGELALLANWPANRYHPTKHDSNDGLEVLVRCKDDLGKWRCGTYTAEAVLGMSAPGGALKMGTARFIHHTLILTGAEHLLSPGSRDFDPLSEHALWGLANEAKTRHVNIILIIPTATQLSTKLGDRSYLIEEKLPTRGTLEGLWSEFLDKTPDAYIRRVCPTKDRDDAAEVIASFGRRAVDHLVGLTTHGATRAVALATCAAYAPEGDFLPRNDDGELLHSRDSARDRELRGEHFLRRLATVKAEAIKQSGALEIGTTVSLDDVGGLDILKEWIGDCGVTFNEQAKAAGVEPPKGVLLVGPPGTGKTLCAKAIAGFWDMTLIVFDLASLFGSLVGQSESNMRTALATLDAAAPCVVLVDEIEKGLAGSSGGSNDGGTSQRVYGTFLTWMQERGKTAETQGHVIVVATANDIAQLPPALLRKGRFDEIFYVDLPNESEREEILRVHLGKLPPARQPECSDDEMRELISACAGFVGSEIEQAIKEANRKSFREEMERLLEVGATAEQEIKLTPEHVVAAMQGTCPLSLTMAENIAANREWSKDRLRFASTVEAPPAPNPDVAQTVPESRFSNLGSA